MASDIKPNSWVAAAVAAGRVARADAVGKVAAHRAKLKVDKQVVSKHRVDSQAVSKASANPARKAVKPGNLGNPDNLRR